jgi:hypothetical protein
MKTTMQTLGLLLAVGLVASVLLLLSITSSQRPLTLRLLGATNDSAGDQFAYFCLSNHGWSEIVYLGDATSLPYYHLTEALLLDPTNRVFLLTNYNQARFFTAKNVTLQPGSSVTFPVQVPKGVTGALLQLSYLRPKGRLEKLARDVFAKLRGAASEVYKTIDVRQPFENKLKPVDKDLIQFTMSSRSRDRSDSAGVTGSGKSVTNSTVAADGTGFLRVAVIGPRTVERMRTLCTKAGFKVVIEKMSITDGSFPPDSYSVSVPEAMKPQAISLIRKDAPVGKYWIQVQF